MPSRTFFLRSTAFRLPLNLGEGRGEGDRDKSGNVPHPQSLSPGESGAGRTGCTRCNSRRYCLLALGLLAAFINSAAAQDADRGLLDEVSIAPKLLEVVEDHTRGVRYEEREAYYQVLQHARETDDERERAAARRFADERRRTDPKYEPYVDLFKHPDAYRGKPVALSGHVRRLIPVPVDENEWGITSLYEAWLYTEDSQTNPAVVIFTDLPEGMPTGGELTEQAGVTGYFFKMYVYQAQDTTRVAPLILADSIEWLPAPVSPRVQVPRWVYVVVAAAVLLLVLVLWLTGRRDRRSRPPLPDEPIDINRELELP